MIDFSKIKLVIWDLDDTFWQGILSEGEIRPIQENCTLVKELSRRGIVNSICSKNDFAPTMKELHKIGVDDFFVFPSIDWTPKGNRIARMIKDMGLRPANCLFIDDNDVNLNEAKYYSEDLMTASPTIVSQLSSYVNSLEISDESCMRLKQYKVLEVKQKAKEESGDNIAFLYASNTRVELHTDCDKVADRLFERVHRTNQLNFTKYRCSRAEFDELLSDKDARCGYATVKDNFGDYGIVGFYAIKNNKLAHFLFSCRTIGQGVEQWVYSTLGCPSLITVEPVVNHVENVLTPPAWINQTNLKSGDREEKKYDGKIVFKGPCDLEIVSSYLNATNLVREFTYVGSNQASVEHQNHSVNYLAFPFLNEAEKKELLNDCIFNDKDMFSTKMYDSDTVLVFISTLIEGNLGIYRRKKDGYLLAYGEWCYSLTDENNWPLYINNKIYTGGNRFTENWLRSFSDKYEYVGRITPTKVVENILSLLNKLPQTTSLCLMLGSEIPYEMNTSYPYQKREEYHQELNAKLKQLAEREKRLYLINFSDYIHSQEDFTNNINHFQRRVYFEVSKSANQIIAQVTGKSLKEEGELKRFFIDKKGEWNNRLGKISILRRIVRFIKSKL